MVHCPKCSNFEFMRTKVYYQLKKIKIKHVLYKQSGICLEEQTIMIQFVSEKYTEHPQKHI